MIAETGDRATVGKQGTEVSEHIVNDDYDQKQIK